jgi:hypothetical protein
VVLREGQRGQRASITFILGDPMRPAWTRALMRFVLETAAASHPSIRPAEYLVVKEPEGATGAPLLMDALREVHGALGARPRDAVASALEATEKGGWRYDGMDADSQKRRELQEECGLAPFGKATANSYSRQIFTTRQIEINARITVPLTADSYGSEDAPSTLRR